MKSKFKILFLSILLFIFCCKNEENSQNIESLVDTDYDITKLLSHFDGTGLTYEINNNIAIFYTQDLPNHTSPYWDSSNELYEAYNGVNNDFNINPNKIKSQEITINIPLFPVESNFHQDTPLGPIGISRNGVVFFNQYAGPNQPLTSEIDSFDQWFGHPQQHGAYHYHIEPIFLTQEFGEDAFLGLLADGFPVYGSVEDGKRLISSDLDEYHGHFSVTEDFSEGIYHYHITVDDPYINGNGFFGTPGNISN